MTTATEPAEILVGGNARHPGLTTPGHPGLTTPEGRPHLDSHAIRLRS
jgi:hypothetical protein